VHELAWPEGLDDVLAEHEGVLGTSLTLWFMTESQLRWRITSGRWQKPSRGVVVAQSGPPTDRQLLRAALLRAGPQAVFAGLAAARLGRFKGFGDKRPIREMPIYLLVPAGYKRRTPPFGLNVVTHYSRALTNLDVHPTWQPRQTRIARSLIDAAVWMPTDRGAMAILAAGVQVGKAGQPQAGDRPLQRWDDMERNIDLGLDGYLTLRFPAWLVRKAPEYVARRILQALRRAGYQG